MVLTPDPPGTPQQPTRPSVGARTPSSIANELSKLDLPAPSNLRLNTLAEARSPLSAGDPMSALSAGSADTGDLSGPEPEAITFARHKARSESMSEQLSSQLSRMQLPQPERIFGPNEGESAAAREGEESGGVGPDDWAKVKLDDETPEAIKEPVRMTHSRNASRV